MFYDIFVKLCAENRVSQSKVMEEVGLNRSAITKWKGGAVPNGATLSKLASYFNVSTDYLLSNNNEKAPPQAQQGELKTIYFSLAKDMQDKGVDPEDIRQILDILQRGKNDGANKG